MDVKIRDKWVKALSSGKYEQCSGALRKGNKFCCLGVLTDLYVKENIKDKEDILSWKEYGSLPDGTSAMLSKDVMAWAGIKGNKSENPLTKEKDDDGVRLTLIDLNDMKKYSFKKLAEVIKRDL